MANKALHSLAPSHRAHTCLLSCLDIELKESSGWRSQQLYYGRCTAEGCGSGGKTGLPKSTLSISSLILPATQSRAAGLTQQQQKFLKMTKWVSECTYSAPCPSLTSQNNRLSSLTGEQKGVERGQEATGVGNKHSPLIPFTPFYVLSTLVFLSALQKCCAYSHPRVFAHDFFFLTLSSPIVWWPLTHLSVFSLNFISKGNPS